MRKFFGIVFISIIFFACLYAGIYLAENTAPTPKSNTNFVNFESANQNNILLIVVDQLDQSPTNFISAWTIVFYYHNPDGLIILPLSLQGNENNTQISEIFHLDNKKFITKQSINAFQQEFDMNWDGIILVDFYAIQTILPWISSQSINFSIEEIMTMTANTDSLSSLIEPICDSISQNLAPLELLNFESIFNSHLLSNLSEEKLKSIWTKFSTENLMDCEWLLPN